MDIENERMPPWDEPTPMDTVNDGVQGISLSAAPGSAE